MTVTVPDSTASFLEQMPDAAFVLDSQGMFRLWNASAEQLLGYSATEVLNKSLESGLFPDCFTLKNLQDRFQQSNNQGFKVTGCVVKNRAGQTIALDFSITMMRSAADIFYIFICRPGPSQNLEALHTSHQTAETLLNYLFDRVPMLVCRFASDSHIHYMNPALQNLLGNSVDHFSTRHWRDVLCSAKPCPLLDTSFDDIASKTFETQVLTPLQQTHYIVWSFVVFKDETGLFQEIIAIGRDVTQERLADDAALKLLSQQDALLNNIPHIAWLKDKESNFIAVNEAFAKICNTTRHAIIGKNDHDYWPKELAEKYRADDANVVAEGKPVQVQELFLEWDGTLKWIETSKTPIRDSNGDVIGTAGIARDITEYKLMEEELRHAKDQALTFAQLQSQFLAVMSHEIRTPINGILGLTEIVSETDLSSEQKEHIALIQDCGHGLLRIVNDVLDFSKIQSDTIDLELLPFDLRKCVRETVELHRHQLNAKGLTIQFDVADNVPARLVGDAYRLRQILSNLINNAAKFTVQGGISINVIQESVIASSRDLMLRFSIKDTGMGFPKEQLDTIFMPFRQIDHPSVAKGSGVGLGLSICKKLVQLMHGDISAESQPGIGTTFTFTAVFRQVEDGTVYESQSMQAAVDFTNRSQPLHILVVEDNAVNQLVVRQMLQTAGCRVTIVVNGQEALEFLLHNSVDLILMDVQLPVMDGYETTRKIRTLEGAGQRKPVPIIAITANALKGDSERCLEAGMNAYLSKPFSRNALLSAIGSLVSG